jgi:hypothetical protein
VANLKTAEIFCWSGCLQAYNGRKDVGFLPASGKKAFYLPETFWNGRGWHQLRMARRSGLEYFHEVTRVRSFCCDANDYVSCHVDYGTGDTSVNRATA